MVVKELQENSIQQIKSTSLRLLLTLIQVGRSFAKRADPGRVGDQCHDVGRNNVIQKRSAIVKVVKVKVGASNVHAQTIGLAQAPILASGLKAWH